MDEARENPERKAEFLLEFEKEIGDAIDVSFLENTEMPELLRCWLITEIQGARKQIEQAGSSNPEH